MKVILDILRNFGIVWFALMVVWHLAELLEVGQDYADPTWPCIFIALLVSCIYTPLRELSNTHEPSIKI